MTKFQNGPAHGVVLMLKRAPVYLRVVQNSKGQFDALDQPNDTPAKDETIYAYKIHGEAGGVHINNGGKPGGGFFTMAEYRYIEEQPDDDIKRQRRMWAAWCERMGK